MRIIVYIYIILLPLNFYAQEKDTLQLSEKYFSVNDVQTITLNEVHLLSKRKFKSQQDIYYYSWLRKKVYKAYPYAILASKRLDTLASRLERIEEKSKRRKYTKIIQRYLEGEFTDQLKKLTKTEGEILIKLIHRQTGKTVFEQIKDFRSGWNAFWYNATANVFSLSLKTEYDPKQINEDFLIEEILQSAFIEEALIEQKSKVEFDFYEIYKQRNGEINVEKYKLMFDQAKKRRERRNKN